MISSPSETWTYKHCSLNFVCSNECLHNVMQTSSWLSSFWSTHTSELCLFRHSAVPLYLQMQQAAISVTPQFNIYAKNISMLWYFKQGFHHFLYPPLTTLVSHPCNRSAGTTVDSCSQSVAKIWNESITGWQSHNWHNNQLCCIAVTCIWGPRLLQALTTHLYCYRLFEFTPSYPMMNGDFGDYAVT